MTKTAHADAPPDPAANLCDIVRRLKEAAADVGERAAPIALTAVTKGQPGELIVPLLEAGHRVFGENRVQEALGKWPPLRERYADIVLHLIGPLQSNKAREAVASFDVIETLDREKLARALADEMARQNRRPRLLIQVNTGEELQKAGIAPQDTPAFVALCRDDLSLPVEGLMCIPPADEAPGPHFALLAKIADRCDLRTLSMGMSADYETAARLGSTHVRIGTALFGPRR